MRLAKLPIQGIATLTELHTPYLEWRRLFSYRGIWPSVPTYQQFGFLEFPMHLLQTRTNARSCEFRRSLISGSDQRLSWLRLLLVVYVTGDASSRPGKLFFSRIQIPAASLHERPAVTFQGQTVRTLKSSCTSNIEQNQHYIFAGAINCSF